MPTHNHSQPTKKYEKGLFKGGLTYVEEKGSIQKSYYYIGHWGVKLNAADILDKIDKGKSEPFANKTSFVSSWHHA